MTGNCYYCGADPDQRWQPIESAPKDGTHILGFWGKHPDAPPCIDVIVWFEGSWVDQDDIERRYADPSHWMHLPAPPAARAGLPLDALEKNRLAIEENRRARAIMEEAFNERDD